MIILKKNHATPLKEQLQNWITRQVQSGSLSTGDQIPSINSLSDRFQISRETVRLSLDSLVARGFLVPEHGKGYFITPRKSRILRVALLAKINGVYIRPIYEGLQTILKEDASIFLVDLQDSSSWISTIKSLAYQHSIDRLLIVPPRGKEEALAKDLKPFRRYFKIAWLDRAPKKSKDPTFLCDYERCVRLALDYFDKRGIQKKIYFSRTPEDQSVFSKMRESYVQYQKDTNSTPLIFSDYKKIYSAASSQSPMGIIAETDFEAVYLQSQLIREGVTIPKEVSIISCDNSELTNTVTPTISAVDPRFQELGKQAGLWIKEETSAHKPLHFVAQPLLVKKESSL